MTERIALQRRASPRLVAVAAVAVGGLFGGLLAGRPELVAVAAPFAVIFVGGVVLAERPVVSVDIRPESDRVVAGEDIVVAITVTSTVPASRVALWMPHLGFASVVEPEDRQLSWAVRVAGSAVLTARLHTPRWGVESLGPARLDVSGPFGLVRWVGRGQSTSIVRVLPDDGTLQTLLPNLEPRTASGAHVARRRGDGFEFAEIRQYREGDRLRSVNWYQTARRGELWVNDHHPERSGDLVVVVDTFADRRPDGSASLENTVRAAWQIAMAHLAAHDRVGIVAFGGLPAWVLPGGGERARLAVLDRLLDSSATWNEAQRSVSFLPRPIFPAGAQVIAVSGLHDERMTSAIADLARSGHDTSVVVIEERETAGPDVAEERRPRQAALEARAARAPPCAGAARDTCRVDGRQRPRADLRPGESTPSPSSAVVVTAARPVVRWGATVGATSPARSSSCLPLSAASADGRRGVVVFGIAGVLLLIAGLVFGSGVYPAGLVAIGVSFAFSLAGHQVGSVEVITATALLLLVDQLAAWAFDAATGAVERGRAISVRCLRVVAIVLIGSAVERAGPVRRRSPRARRTRGGSDRHRRCSRWARACLSRRWEH